MRCPSYARSCILPLLFLSALPVKGQSLRFFFDNLFPVQDSSVMCSMKVRKIAWYPVSQVALDREKAALKDNGNTFVVRKREPDRIWAEFEFNRRGQLSRMLLHQKDKDDWEKVLLYDENGRLSGFETAIIAPRPTWGPPRWLNDSVGYIHDAQGRLYCERSRNGAYNYKETDGKWHDCQVVTEYRYNSRGELTSVEKWPDIPSHLVAASGKYLLRRDSLVRVNGLLIQSFAWDGGGKLILHDSCGYDAQGRLIFTRNDDHEAGQRRLSYLRYDDRGRVSKRLDHTPYTRRKRIIKYFYDEDGLLLECIFNDEFDNEMILEAEYAFYDD